MFSESFPDAGKHRKQIGKCGHTFLNKHLGSLFSSRFFFLRESSGGTLKILLGCCVVFILARLLSYFRYRDYSNHFFDLIITALPFPYLLTRFVDKSG